MKKIAFILMLFMCGSFNTVFAQSWEWGVSVQNIKFNGNTLPSDPNGSGPLLSDVEGSVSYFSADVGISIPLVNFTDELSLGVQAGIFLGTAFASSGTGPGPESPGFNIGAPGYLTLKAGAGSNRNSRLPVGLGLGFGYQYTGFLAEVSNGNPEDLGLYRITTPNIMVELAFDFGRSSSIFDNLKLRYERQLGDYRKAYFDERSSLDFGYNFTQSKVSWIYFLDYR